MHVQHSNLVTSHKAEKKKENVKKAEFFKANWLYFVWFS